MYCLDLLKLWIYCQLLPHVVHNLENYMHFPKSFSLLICKFNRTKCLPIRTSTLVTSNTRQASNKSIDVPSYKSSNSSQTHFQCFFSCFTFSINLDFVMQSGCSAWAEEANNNWSPSREPMAPTHERNCSKELLSESSNNGSHRCNTPLPHSVKGEEINTCCLVIQKNLFVVQKVIVGWWGNISLLAHSKVPH